MDGLTKCKRHLRILKTNILYFGLSDIITKSKQQCLMTSRTSQEIYLWICNFHICNIIFGRMSHLEWKLGPNLEFSITFLVKLQARCRGVIYWITAEWNVCDNYERGELMRWNGEVEGERTTSSKVAEAQASPQSTTEAAYSYPGHSLFQPCALPDLIRDFRIHDCIHISVFPTFVRFFF